MSLRDTGQNTFLDVDRYMDPGSSDVNKATGTRPVTARLSVADWGGGMSACCTVGLIVRYRGQCMAA